MVSQTADISGLQSGVHTAALPIKRSWGAFLLAMVEAVCLFYISAAKLGLTVAATSIAASSWATVLHRDIFRVPILSAASMFAVFNLFLIWRGQRLLNAPAAAWRRQSPSATERWRTGFVVSASLLTLFVALAEFWLHHLLHR